MMKRSFLFFVLPILLFYMTLGCGMKKSGSAEPMDEFGLPLKSLTETDERLAGQWIAEMLNDGGDRVLLTIDISTGRRRVSIVAIKPAGETIPVTEGSYAIEENKITFALNALSGFTSNFSLTDERLTLGTDVYYRVTGALDHPQLSGQIRIFESAADRMVKVKSPSLKGAGGVETGEVLVQYKNGTMGKIIVRPEASQLQALSLTPSDSGALSALSFQALAVRDLKVKAASEIMEGLRRRADVEFAVHNRILKTTSADPLFKDQWNLDLLNMTDTWAHHVRSRQKTVVAVIDTGYDPDHPDLAGRVEPASYDFVSKSVADVPDLSLDGDGPDADFTDPGWPGSIHHGTHILGIIAANYDNNVGIAGITPPNVTALVLRAMGHEGNGTLFDVAQAIRYAAKLPNVADCDFVESNFEGQTVYAVDDAKCFDQKTRDKDPARDNRPMARVINLSLGAEMTPADAKPLTDAIHAATARGILVVASAGNTHSNSTNFYPAADPYVLAVGAVSSNLAFASAYSNYGNHELVAPGGSGSLGVLSTTGATYSKLIGTSQSAAHVSAVAAMVFAENPNMRPADAIKVLQDSAIDLGEPGKDAYYGYGLVNPCGALLKAQGISPSPVLDYRLSTGSIDFGPLGSLNTVIANGCGVVSGLSPQVETKDGRPWLEASVKNGSTYVRIDVKVSREGLAQGDYAGSITVGDKTINVTMKVSDYTAEGDDIDNLINQIDKLLSSTPDYRNTVDVGMMIVLMVDAKTGESKYYTKTNFRANYNFTFGGIASANYYLLAGLDENNDGKICVEGEDEACSAYPSLAVPEVIQVDGITKRNDLVWDY